MDKYQVKPGKRFGMAGLEWPAMVELRSKDAKGFLDLLEPVSEQEPELARIVDSSEATEPEVVAEPVPAPAPVKPSRAKKV